MEKTLNEIAAKSLGDSTSYAVFTDKYDPSLLNPMPRDLGRADWKINPQKFSGVDVWHAHESSFLTDNGLPVAGTLKFMYSSDSVLMVESKSMKLFLNSFDMCKMGPDVDSAIRRYCSVVKRELERVIGEPVSIGFFMDGATPENPVEGYNDLFDVIPDLPFMKFDDYSGKGNHLVFQKEEGLNQTVKVKTNILRSRCRHTKQKDTGTAFITIQTENGLITLDSLLRQIVSLRECNEFHELLAEKLFQDINSVQGVVGCQVILMYNRRGSLDINPIRTNKTSWIPDEFLDMNTLTQKTQGQ